MMPLNAQMPAPPGWESGINLYFMFHSEQCTCFLKKHISDGCISNPNDKELHFVALTLPFFF